MDVSSGVVPTYCERICEEQDVPEGSIAEGYIREECLTFCSKFLDVDTKLNRVDRHESIVVNEPPSSLSIFAEMDYKRRG